MGATVRIAKTRVIDDDLNPKWLEKFEHVLCQGLDSIKFTIKDKSVFKKSKNVGTVTIPAEELTKQEEIKKWFEIDGPRENNGSILLSVHYISTSKQKAMAK